MLRRAAACVVWRWLRSASRKSRALLVATLLLGLALRLVFAPFSTGSDIVQFAGFAKTIQRHGLCFYSYAATFWEEAWPYNWPYLYGPVLAYILNLLAYVATPSYTTFWLNNNYFAYASQSWVLALKLVFIAFDTLVAVLLYMITRRVALVALYYLNPAVIYVSSIYGMFDQISLALLLAGLALLERRRLLLSGALLALALLTKQTMLFPLLGLALLLLIRYRRAFKGVAIGFIIGTLLVLSPIIAVCPASFTGLRNTWYMLKPRYAEPIMYSFNGVTSVATLLHKVYGVDTLWLIERWYMFTALLVVLPVLYTLRKGELYINTALYYLLFTATYWGVNYQYLTPLIGLLAVAIVREERRYLKMLYAVLALYIGAWFFIFPVEWWFRAHIENPNRVLLEAVKSISLNVYVDNYYAPYSLVLTVLEYIALALAMRSRSKHLLPL
uniref:DUF2029 domain-containing protein n=1 Tax=Ignisphaera aggregans TaxID=334771 RepID=A0A7J3Z6G8_9CREN